MRAPTRRQGTGEGDQYFWSNTEDDTITGRTSGGNNSAESSSGPVTGQMKEKGIRVSQSQNLNTADMEGRVDVGAHSLIKGIRSHSNEIVTISQTEKVVVVEKEKGTCIPVNHVVFNAIENPLFKGTQSTQQLVMFESLNNEKASGLAHSLGPATGLKAMDVENACLGILYGWLMHALLFKDLCILLVSINGAHLYFGYGPIIIWVIKVGLD
ncbi:hypothetical protein LguiA_036500 [Lonicera macranthoides]